MLKAFIRIPVFAAFFSLAFLALSTSDPFGIDDAIDQQSRNIIYRAFAGTYGSSATDVEQFDVEHRLWTPPTELVRSVEGSNRLAPQDQIVTVYLSDNVLRQLRDRYKTPADPAGSSDEDDMLAGWQAWRPSYFDQAELVYSLATVWQLKQSDGGPARKPPAIFFDFIFLETGASTAEKDNFELFISEISQITRRSDWEASLDAKGRDLGCDDPYLKIVCIKAAGGIPLIFARGENPVLIDPSGEIEPAQSRLNEVAIIAPVRYLTRAGDYPVETTSMSTLEERQFTIDNPSQPIPEYPTPAALLYLAWCMDGFDRCAWLEPDQADNPQMSELSRWRHMALKFGNRKYDPISMVWGAKVPNYFADVERTMTGQRPGLIRSGPFGDTLISAKDEGSQILCRLEEGQDRLSGILTGFAMVFRQVLSQGLGTPAGSLTQQCPYHLEVPYLAIASNATTTDVVRSIFDGRVIIVGSRFKNSGDIIRSTVHGQLPGLHGHAMATDNLMQMHAGYLRSPPKHRFLFGAADTLDILETLVMFVVLLIVATGQWWLNKRLISEEKKLDAHPGRNARPSHWAAYFLVLIAVGVFVFIFAIVQVLVFHLAPLNWISLTAAASGVFVYLLRDEIADDASRFLRRTPIVGRVGNPVLDFLTDQRRYLDLETVGFEKSGVSLDDARKEKDRVVARLYPELEKDRD